jgi:hypothetical protein
MSRLVALLGRENVDRLSKAAGGTVLYVPKHYGKPPNGGRDSSERLGRMFGESLAVLLVFHFSNSRLYVPKPRDAEPVDINKLRRLARSKRSAREITLLLGGACTNRQVEKVRERERKRHNGTRRPRA